MSLNHPKYIVGIDLGTTHSVVASTRTTTPEDEAPDVQLLPIMQVVALGEVNAQPLLPSFLFLPGWSARPNRGWPIAGSTARSRSCPGMCRQMRGAFRPWRPVPGIWNISA